jgi:sugar-specific transcriptional regulator TrmB
MLKIPQDLIQSLRTLGLLESEARLYVALVLMNNAEVKELIDFLGLSKPGTYESLRSLEDKGLIVRVNATPITYQAVPPDIGLEILIDTHVKAKEEAKDRLSTLDKGQALGKTSQSLWCVFNRSSIEYKIGDMLRNAQKNVFLVASEPYVRHFVRPSNPNLDLEVIVFSENPDVERSLSKLFKTDPPNVRVVSTRKVLRELSELNSLRQEQFMRPIEETLLMFDFDSFLFLIVDDAEILCVPPLSGEGTLAFNLRDARAIANMKLRYQASVSYFRKGEN